MSVSALRGSLLALLATGAVVALPQGPTINAVGEWKHDDWVVVFCNKDCEDWKDSGKKLDFTCDISIPDGKKSVYIPKHEHAAAFSEWEENDKGELVCCGDFLGYFDDGCHELSVEWHHKDKDVKCLRPVPEGWEEHKKPKKPEPEDDCEEDEEDDQCCDEIHIYNHDVVETKTVTVYPKPTDAPCKPCKEPKPWCRPPPPEDQPACNTCEPMDPPQCRPETCPPKPMGGDRPKPPMSGDGKTPPPPSRK